MNISAGAMLGYLAGAAAFVCVVMAVYWAMQRVPAGFGLWTASSALVAAVCVLVLGRGRLPEFVMILLVPGTAILAAALRGQGLARFLGHRRFGSGWLALPIMVVGLLAVLRYAWDNPFARAVVIAAAMALVSWVAASIMFADSREGRRWFPRFLAVVFVAYGALWLGYGLHWVIGETGFPIAGVDTAATVFLAAITAFEIFWVVACLFLSAKWNAQALEAARVAAEKELRALAEVVMFLPDATFALGKDRRVIAWNRGAEEMTGIPAERVIGVPWEETGAGTALGNGTTLSEGLLDPNLPLPPAYHNVQRLGDSISAEEEASYPGLPEELLHVWRTATLLRDAEGKVRGTIECLRDVTWRAETERAVRESEERYRSLFENNLDGVLVIAPGGTIIDANAAACHMLGMTEEELCDIDSGALIQGNETTRQMSSEDSALGTAVRELTFIRRDGSTFPAEAMSVVWNDASGRLRAFVQFRDISERIETRKVVRESEARLLEVQAASLVGNWEIDLVSQSIWISPETRHIYGIEQDSPYFPLEENHLSDLMEDPEVMQKALEGVMSDGGSYDIEYRIRRANDGALRSVRSVGAAITGEDDAPVKVVGVVRDVTDLETNTSASEFARYALDHSGEQVFWADPEGRFMSVSDSACEELGYTREELLSMTIYDINPALDPSADKGWETLKKQGTRRFESTNRSKDGREVPVEVTVQYLVHDGAECSFVVARDISERKRLEETLRRAQLSLDQGSEEIFWIDPQGRFVFVTESTCTHLGYSREELLAMSIFDVDPTASADWNLGWTTLVQQGTLSRQTTHWTKEGSEVPVEIAFNHVEYDGKDYAVVFARTIDDTKGAIQQLSDGEIQSLQSEKLEAVGRLAGGIAHDFNNLLTAIIGYGNLILTSEESQGLESLRKDAGEIKGAAERAAALTSQILAFARCQPLRPQMVNLSDLIAGLRERLQPLLGDKIELAILSADELSLVEVDKGQFAEAVVNLAKNACEAMVGGGRLTLELKNAELSEEYCKAYPELRPGAYVMLSCSDTGVGMDADTRLRIFEPFFTTKSPGEGAGLGLSMVYGTVKQSGGHILAYSEVGKGTTLKVYLPRVTDSTGVGAWTEQATRSVAGGETIVVVDDEAPLRRLVSRVLGDLGYKVFVAGNGPEALELVEDLESAPDLLVTDVILPAGLQGNELAQKLTAAVPELPVLYMSGHPRDAIMHAGRLDHGVFFLSKPFTPQELAAKVQEVLGSPQKE